ncbi:MAG: hypothetical protein AAF493_09510 [Pseudomonadota bacterium]
MAAAIVTYSATGTCAEPESRPETRLGASGDWEFFTTVDDEQRTCYAGTGNGSREPDTAPRTWLLLSKRTSQNEPHVVSVEHADKFQVGSTLNVRVGSQQFVLYTQGNTAWTVDAVSDRRLVGAMRNNQELRITGRGAGAPIEARFSLRGFENAYRAVVETCETN